jgi:hypothetical protein
MTYVSFKPDRNIYQDSDMFSIRIQSPNEYVNLEKSYCKFNITTDSVSYSTIGNMGCSSIFESVSDTFDGITLPIVNNYNLYNTIFLNTMDTESKSLYNRLTGYISEDDLHRQDAFRFTDFKLGAAVTETVDSYATIGNIFHSGNPNFNGRAKPNSSVPVYSIIPNLPSSIKSKIIPLSGRSWEVTYKLAPLNTVINYLGANTTHYYVNNFELILYMYPGVSIDYSIIGPYVRSYQQLLNGTNNEFVKLNLGHVMVKDIFFFIRDRTLINVNTLDSFKASAFKYLLDYFIEINSQRYPRNHNITVKNDGENILQLLHSGLNLKNLQHLKPVVTGNFFDRTFCSFHFENGIPSNDSELTINLNMVVAANLILDCFIVYY